jgi:hypothetical protein
LGKFLLEGLHDGVEDLRIDQGPVQAFPVRVSTWFREHRTWFRKQLNVMGTFVLLKGFHDGGDDLRLDQRLVTLVHQSVSS